MAEPKHGLRPMVVDETPGKKAYCQCGWSENLPYCDGSHTRMQTGVAPFVCTVDAPGRKSVCQCHQTKNAPWCDGTHKQLAPQPGPPQS